MTDDLVKRLRDEHLAMTRNEAADRIEALTAQLESTLRDRKLILEERDRTFALMLVRAENAEADNARLQNAIDDVVCGRGMFGLSADDDLKWAMQHLGSALNTGKEVGHE